MLEEEAGVMRNAMTTRAPCGAKNTCDLLNFFTQLDPDLTLRCILSSHLTTHPHDSGPGPPEAVVDPQVLLHLDGVLH